MLKCFVVGCDNKSNKKRPGISFHTFPKNYELRLNAISRPEYKPSKGSIICSNHFNENDINYTLCRLRLKYNVCPFLYIPPKRGRGQHSGDKHGAGNKGSGQRQNYMRLGYETGNNPFYLRMPHEPYYKGHHQCIYTVICSHRREYPPISLLEIQKLIDINRIDITQPIDIASIVKSGLYHFFPDQKHFGINLTDEGVDLFAAKINIEVQWASEPVIAAIEKNGGVITTAYYDPHSLFLLKNPKKFFETGQAIPRRMIPPPDVIEYYTSAATRGYLADPEKISQERLRLSQKYGYKLPKLESDLNYNMLSERKDPRQIFYGLEPGWVVNLKDRCILKPKDEELLQFYSS